MKNRNPVAVILLSIVTLGIYALVWSVKTKNEMNAQGAKIPTAWIWLIPVIGWLYWTWKYSEGVQLVTKGAQTQVIAFILLALLSIIGMAILQNEYNKLNDAPAGAPVTA